MPTIRRRSASRRGDFAELTTCQRAHLETGRVWLHAGFKDRESFTAAWEVHGERITEEWISKRPGSRPFGWWLCTHGKERSVCDDVTAEDIKRERESLSGQDHFGYLHSSAIQESERDYLERHSLLSPEEIAALRQQDMEMLDNFTPWQRVHCRDVVEEYPEAMWPDWYRESV